jgi:ABC-type branched-subunit amino acid transport system substrate-binding protein
MIYTNVSFVGSTALADELMLLGPRYASGVIVTQVVPAVSGYSSAVLEYKNALAKYFPGEAPDYVSLEGYVAANVLIQGLRRTGPQLDTEKLIDVLEKRAISTWVLEPHSTSAAPNIRRRTRSGERRSMKMENIRRSNSNKWRNLN